MYKIDNTVAAISTAAGAGGIGIVRITGADTVSVLSKIFTAHSGKKAKDIKSHTITYGYIKDGDDIIDEVLVSYMKAPNTYTREDIAEINCHGGIRCVKRVLETVLKNGADMAEPGEFTKRAFLNGRIDLIKAEAVNELISSKTELARKAAMNRLCGGLSDKIKNIREKVLTMTAHIEADIDYPEHDEQTKTLKSIYKDINKIQCELQKMYDMADNGKIINDGIKTVILGCPNVGKSSILNRIINEERAIVTDIPGTTRDILTEYVNINGIPLNIVDTAGIRDTNDKIEKIGVIKSKNQADDADLVMLVIDGSKGVLNEDEKLFDFVKNKKCAAVINKSDKKININEKEIEMLKNISNNNLYYVSALNNTGFEELFNGIRDMFFNGSIDINSESFIGNERDKSCVFKAIESLKNASFAIENNVPEDLISIDLFDCLEYLGQITGDSVSDDVIDKIFTEFCLGK